MWQQDAEVELCMRRQQLSAVQGARRERADNEAVTGLTLHSMHVLLHFRNRACMKTC